MKKRPKSLQGETPSQDTGCGKAYVTINTLDGDIFEVFFRLGKAGGCAAAQNEAIGRLLSCICRGGTIEDAIRSLKGITCTESDKNYDSKENKKFACAHAIAVSIEKFLKIKPLEPFDEDKVKEEK